MMSLLYRPQGDFVDELLRALAANLTLLLTGGVAAILGACATVTTACVLLRKSGMEIRKTEAEAHKIELETDLSLEERIHNLWTRMDAQQSDNFEMRHQLTVKNAEIADVNFEVTRLKARSMKRDEEYTAMEHRLQECEAKWRRMETTELTVQIVKPESGEMTP